jgi:hypothetical protein
MFFAVFVIPLILYDSNAVSLPKRTLHVYMQATALDLTRHFTVADFYFRMDDSGAGLQFPKNDRWSLRRSFE